MTEQEQIAAFLATRGVRKLPASASSGLTSRDWSFKIRGEKTDDELIAERHVTIGHGGREFVTNGLGERIS